MALEQVYEYVQAGIDQSVDVGSQVTQLFEAQRDSLYRYVVTLIGESGAAEEITQDVFLKLYEHLLKGIQVVNVRSWSYRVAHNLAIDFVRAQKLSAFGGDILWSGLAETCSDSSLGPEELVLHSEKAAHFRTALASLPVQQRACLLLRAEGFRYREIAQMLGVAVPTVGESLRRGLQRLMQKPHV
ncbi:MAG TPA: RNA polymerase sigma factor [Bryobacteraceae bacterium]|nr:RNA polymerase sigma factor [Bryobacteraceae bacterium]